MGINSKCDPGRCNKLTHYPPLMALHGFICHNELLLWRSENWKQDPGGCFRIRFPSLRPRNPPGTWAGRRVQADPPGEALYAISLHARGQPVN